MYDTAHPTNFSVNVPNALRYHSFLEDDLLTSVSKISQNETREGLDKLLSLSSAFCLTSEVTPIQAWQQIVSHPKFVVLNMSLLRQLLEEMLEHVRCYGYDSIFPSC